MSTELNWFKSTYSGTGGGDCVEVALSWRKSSHSNTEGGECVEVATSPTAIHLRDSKLTSSPQFAVPAASWTAFIAYATAD
ncbi:DUF397 domain-containing protein [Streptomyces sp. NBC_01465]|uniref:DUF397 domain-containing protein n=1 Tax=Streptomyces sp. NBC_01465 TaxID=2903878 RepID=UPI002E3242A5|nr:DUF397 domain-containing protein [Streptomyces sp. NBC_01465]